MPHMGGDDVVPGYDPEFDPAARSWKGEQERRRIQFRMRSMLLGILVVGVWLGLLFDPLAGPLVRLGLLVIGLVLGVMVLAMGLGWLGFGLFAVGDRVVGWFRRSTRWPES